MAAHYRSLGHQVTVWSFNPNLYPESERARREVGFAQAAVALSLSVLRTPRRDRGLAGFLLAVARMPGKRCLACYELRLRAAAQTAAAHGFEAFSTTLLVSPYQDVEGIQRVGRAAARREGVAFLGDDLRGKYQESCARSRELGLYRQSYCGCLFSLLERAQRRSLRALSRDRPRR